MNRITVVALVLALSIVPVAQAHERWDIANIPSERVGYWVKRFSHGDKREKIALFLSRKPRYAPMISRELRARHMPQDLIYLAMVESGFNPRADSKARARAAAYNGGQNRIARILKKATGKEHGTDETYYPIWHRLPGETRDYVPAMIAAARIGKDLAKYGCGRS